MANKKNRLRNTHQNLELTVCNKVVIRFLSQAKKRDRIYLLYMCIHFKDSISNMLKRFSVQNYVHFSSECQIFF